MLSGIETVRRLGASPVIKESLKASIIIRMHLLCWLCDLSFIFEGKDSKGKGKGKGKQQNWDGYNQFAGERPVKRQRCLHAYLLLAAVLADSCLVFQDRARHVFDGRRAEAAQEHPQGLEDKLEIAMLKLDLRSASAGTVEQYVRLACLHDINARSRAHLQSR